MMALCSVTISMGIPNINGFRGGHSAGVSVKNIPQFVPCTPTENFYRSNIGEGMFRDDYLYRGCPEQTENPNTDRGLDNHGLYAPMKVDRVNSKLTPY